jgi:hypothetical protein
MEGVGGLTKWDNAFVGGIAGTDCMVNQIKIAVAVIWAVAGAAATTDGGVPRYRFEPGQELTYRIDWTIRYTAPDRTALHDDFTDAVARVVRKNGDGSYRIVVSWRETNSKTANAGLVVTGPWNSVFCLDVFPDGRELPIQNRVGAMPGMLFPPLPRNAGELKDGWTAKLQDFTYACTAEAEKSDYQYRATVDAPVMRRLHDSRTTRFSFDETRGLVSKVNDTFIRDAVPNGAGTGTTRLVAVKAIGDSELKQLVKDTGTYSEALEAYNARMKHAEDVGVDRAREMAQAAKTEFKEAVGKITDADIKALGERVLEGHNARLDSVIAGISGRAARR